MDKNSEASPKPPKFAFFGSSRFSEIVLDELERSGLTPVFVVTTPDKPKGRKLVITPTPVKEWAMKRGIKVFDPAKLDQDFVAMLKNETESSDCEAFVVASYGKIIPASIIDLPPAKTLNIHPSLLPKYRGASPLQSAILDDEKGTGISIMLIDEKMDHGPIIDQKKIDIAGKFESGDWPVYEEFEEFMAKEGARMLTDVMPKWIAGSITPKEQDHASATYTKKIEKADGLLDIDVANQNAQTARQNFLKIQAYHEWPGAFFFIKKDGRDIRVKVTKAEFVRKENGTEGAGGSQLKILKVIPEGGREMDYEDFRRGYSKTI